MPTAPGKTRMIHARVDSKLKASGERVFSRIGLSTTEAIRLFLKQLELYKGLPFAIAIPKGEAVAAIAAANNPKTLHRYKSFRELREKAYWHCYSPKRRNATAFQKHNYADSDVQNPRA